MTKVFEPSTIHTFDDIKNFNKNQDKIAENFAATIAYRIKNTTEHIANNNTNIMIADSLMNEIASLQDTDMELYKKIVLNLIYQSEKEGSCLKFKNITNPPSYYNFFIMHRIYRGMKIDFDVDLPGNYKQDYTNSYGLNFSKPKFMLIFKCCLKNKGDALEFLREELIRDKDKKYKKEEVIGFVEKIINNYFGPSHNLNLFIKNALNSTSTPLISDIIKFICQNSANNSFSLLHSFSDNDSDEKHLIRVLETIDKDLAKKVQGHLSKKLLYRIKLIERLDDSTSQKQSIVADNEVDSLLDAVAQYADASKYNFFNETGWLENQKPRKYINLAAELIAQYDFKSPGSNGYKIIEKIISKERWESCELDNKKLIYDALIANKQIDLSKCLEVIGVMLGRKVDAGADIAKIKEELADQFPATLLLKDLVTRINDPNHPKHLIVKNNEIDSLFDSKLQQDHAGALYEFSSKKADFNSKQENILLKLIQSYDFEQPGSNGYRVISQILSKESNRISADQKKDLSDVIKDRFNKGEMKLETPESFSIIYNLDHFKEHTDQKDFNNFLSNLDITKDFEFYQLIRSFGNKPLHDCEIDLKNIKPSNGKSLEINLVERLAEFLNNPKILETLSLIKSDNEQFPRYIMGLDSMIEKMKKENLFTDSAEMVKPIKTLIDFLYSRDLSLFNNYTCDLIKTIGTITDKNGKKLYSLLDE